MKISAIKSLPRVAWSRQAVLRVHGEDAFLEPGQYAPTCQLVD